MKRVLFSLAILASVTALAADISTSNVIGILPVTSASKRTIVSVPWCAMSATDNAAIQVSNIVKTANLTVGDTLHYVNSDGSYLSWQLAGEGVRYWESVQQAGEGNLSASPGSANQTVARGNCIVLIRQSYTNENGTGKTFYLYGQVGTASAVATTNVVGTSASPAYSLVASPIPASWGVNDDASWSNVGSSDNLVVSADRGWNVMLYWDPTSSKWGTSNDVFTTYGKEKVRTGREFAEYTTDIPAGQGVWYVSRGGAGKPTVTWSSDSGK